MKLKALKGLEVLNDENINFISGGTSYHNTKNGSDTRKNDVCDTKKVDQNTKVFYSTNQ